MFFRRQLRAQAPIPRDKTLLLDIACPEHPRSLASSTMGPIYDTSDRLCRFGPCPALHMPSHTVATLALLSEAATCQSSHTSACNYNCAPRKSQTSPPMVAHIAPPVRCDPNITVAGPHCMAIGVSCAPRDLPTLPGVRRVRS